MSVCNKSRRKICVNNKEYIRYVELDYDSPYHILHIVSEVIAWAIKDADVEIVEWNGKSVPV